MTSCCSLLCGEADRFRLAERTIVVTGSSRGGTSMAALVLRGLGISMGENLAENHEDLDFYSLLHAQDLSLGSWKPVVAGRNEAQATWGFKSPLLLENNALQRVVPLLRNPVLVVVFRNPLATAESQFQRDRLRMLDALLRWERLFGNFRDFCAGVDCPFLAVNYEACIVQPVEFVKALGKIFNLPVNAPEDLARSLISGTEGGYRMLPEDIWEAQFIQGLSSKSSVSESSIPLSVKPGNKVSPEDGSIRYTGSIFSGPGHLIELLPDEVGFGEVTRLHIRYPREVRQDLTNGGHNLYISFGRNFSLGISQFVSRAADGQVLEIKGSKPVQALALGIADDEEFGMIKDLPSISLLRVSSK
jgi:hypothetical protein